MDGYHEKMKMRNSQQKIDLWNLISNTKIGNKIKIAEDLNKNSSQIFTYDDLKRWKEKNVVLIRAAGRVFDGI